MPFPLSDLRRRYGRSGTAGGTPDVRPYLLAGKELRAQEGRLRAVVAWYESRTGHQRRDVDFDDLARVAGDYRLARCLGNCLLPAFRFASHPIDVTLEGVRSPSDLRLLVFEAVAQSGAGFVHPPQRGPALEDVAGTLGVGAEELDRLLWLDAEDNQYLQQIAPAPDTGRLAAAYNRRALATLLVRSLSADLILPAPDGAAIRRLYFLVKRHGLLCELELVDPAAGPSGGVHVHLYGPLEVFGPRTRHGDRFAGVLLGLLFRFPDLEGNARVLLNEREYRVLLGPDVAEALGGDDPLEEALSSQPPLPQAGEGELPVDDDAGAAPPLAPGDAPETARLTPGGTPATVTAVVARPEVAGEFDSEVEARLFSTLRGMTRRGDAAGWEVLREPEPLIEGSTVMVPDFLLTRPAARGRPPLRVFVEVIGFWTPAYRERKREKLRRLGAHVPLLLVTQEALAEHFAGLPFPLLTYKRRVPAAELIRLLNRHFARPAENAPEVLEDLVALLEALDPALGMVGMEELGRALEVPAPGPVGEALGQLQGDVGGWGRVPGVGVAHREWLARLGEHCQAVLAAAGAEGEVPLETLRDSLGELQLPQRADAAEHLEALLGVLGYAVEWQSLFEATVRLSPP